MSAQYQQVKDFFLIGKTLKSHGTAGYMRLMIEDRFKGYLKPGSFVFLDLDGSRVPFRIADADEGQHFIVLLEDINGKQESDTLTGKELWVPMDQIKPRHQKSLRNIKEKWEDYSIHDQATGIDYPILRTEEYPQQLMAVIDILGRDVLVPLNDQLITEVDKEQKIIVMEIPEGLLDL